MIPNVSAFGLMIIALLLIATGCTATPKRVAADVDWPHVRDVLVEADLVVASFESVYRAEDPGRADRLARVRELNAAALQAIDQRIAGEAGDDGGAVEAVRALLDFSDLVIREWPDPRQRVAASAVYATVRASLRLAHARLNE